MPPILCIETILLKASNLETYSEELESFKLSMYKNDVEIDQLSRKLPLLGDVIKQALPSVKQVTTIRAICDAMNTESVYKSMLSEIHKLLRLYLTIPISSSTSERSFSALKRVLTYIRSTMSEQRLNNCMMLHIHKEITDSCDMHEIAKEFVSANSERQRFFGSF